MQKKLVIAIDGPAASGKSTTAKRLAKELQYIYIDTGAMYRACGLRSLQKNIKLDSRNELQEMLENIDITIKYENNGNKIFLNGEDVTSRIREEDISRLSSEIATIDIVRIKMVDLQREMGKNGGVIMDGRDIGTVVFPDANYKFYMVADVKTRSNRRLQELVAKGISTTYDEVEKELLWRDKNDSQREMSPLKKADDAIEIDTSNLSIDQQVKVLLEVIQKTG